MCDFFWPSPADQGDLSDVVRASLQQLPVVATPGAATVYSHESLGAHDLPEEEEELLPLQGANCRGDDLDHYGVHLQQQQLVHGDGMGVMVSSSSSSCDPLLLQSSPSYPQADQGLIQHVMSGPPQQLGAAGVVERECEAGALEMDEHGLDMAMDAHPHAPVIKRRKSQMKKVVCIPAPTAAPPGMGGRPSTSGEVVPSDLWAWRKYGQKPIKGSPYPRGYYRCSSSKGCSARKQVERSRTDPSMLVITYTSDHNHPWPTQRNALAGSTRQLAASSSAATKSHHHQHHSMVAAAAAPQPQPRHCTNSIVRGDSGMPISIGNDAHHQQLPKQEVLDVTDHHRPEQQAAVADHDLDMFADMDGALDILPASNFGSQKEQQHATAADDDDYLWQDDKQGQQLLDPFSFSFFDWVGASFGIGDANKGGYT
ncbi:hypothetical protein EJB05_23199 [Eragrostis curvula]|uniref:WRKY domain-containing protein n=1 Tax=Eragrostis curvula TaxID=38414 RepID=A0A5J9V5M7_9POAL|nr:hypothetical protein EJB05_23199 [Eragrostis curvula]